MKTKPCKQTLPPYKTPLGLIARMQKDCPFLSGSKPKPAPGSWLKIQRLFKTHIYKHKGKANPRYALYFRALLFDCLNLCLAHF
jgi:hypothetical protein